MNDSTQPAPDSPRDPRATIANLINRVEALERENTALKLAQTTSTYRKRPDVLNGRTVGRDVGCGPLYVTLNEDEERRPFEVFFKLGKSGSCQQSYLEALGVAISVGLRYGADPQKFVDKFRGMRCPNPINGATASTTTLSCAHGISQALEAALALAGSLFADEPVDLTVPQKATSIPLVAEPQPDRNAYASGVGLCPRCSGMLIVDGAGKKCINNCGFSTP